jgi:hypothetical protein
MTRIRSRATTVLIVLAAALGPAGIEASESCVLLEEEVKTLCTRTLDNEPVWMSCAFYYRTAFDVLRKGGDEKWSLEDHCRSLHGTMERVREKKKGRGESAEAVLASSDPRCPEQRDQLAQHCLGLFDSDELPAEIETAKCAGRFGLFERGLLEHCG